MPTDVAVAIVSTFGVIIAALLGYLGVVATGARRHAKAAREGVENEHEKPLRDDLDEKFAGLADRFDSIARDVGGIKSDLRSIRKEQSNDREAFERERERIRLLEDTLTPAEIQRLREKSDKEKP